ALFKNPVSDRGFGGGTFLTVANHCQLVGDCVKLTFPHHSFTPATMNAHLLPVALLDAYQLVHAAASNIVERGDQHGPMLVSINLYGRVHATVLDELPREKWKETMHEVATQRDIIVTCLISEGVIARLRPGPEQDFRKAVIFNFIVCEQE